MDGAVTTLGYAKAYVAGGLAPEYHCLYPALHLALLVVPSQFCFERQWQQGALDCYPFGVVKRHRLHHSPSALTLSLPKNSTGSIILVSLELQQALKGLIVNLEY